MAKNINIEFLGDPMTHMDLFVTSPTTNVIAENNSANVPGSGVAVSASGIPGVAESSVEGYTTFTPVVTSCIAEFSVNGFGPGGVNLAVNVGDILYLQTGGTIDKNGGALGAIAFGTAFGNALNYTGGSTPAANNATGIDTRSGQLVASGASTFIRIWVGKFPSSAVTVKTMQVAHFLYNFAVDGGAIGTIVPSIADYIPSGAIVSGGYVNSSTALTSAGAATVGVGTTAGSTAVSVLAQTAKTAFTLDAVIPNTCAATPFKMSAVGQLQLTIAAAALTAGVIEGWVTYTLATNA